MKKKLTALATKRLTLKVWRWLRDHPGCDKRALPTDLWNKIYNMSGNCPLCEYFRDDSGRLRCDLCPLLRCMYFYSPYAEWKDALLVDRPDKAEKAAAEIIRCVEAWDIKEQDK